MFKSKFQIMYNSLKGRLDANMQQYVSIQPPVKTKFEAKYIIRMMIAIVTNAWRSYQLLSETIDIDTFTLSMFKKRLRNSGMPLQEFNYNLAIAHINSSTNPNFLNGIFQATTIDESITEAVNSVEINYSTLRDRLHNQFVPLKHRRRAFMNNRALLELRLAKNSEFQHKPHKIDGGKVKHCALCGVGQTRSECSDCLIPLCVFQGAHLSCFTLWHTERDLESSREAVLQTRNSERNDNCETVQKRRQLLAKNRKSTQSDSSDSSQHSRRRKFKRRTRGTPVSVARGGTPASNVGMRTPTSTVARGGNLQLQHQVLLQAVIQARLQSENHPD
jgi:hypothetical protein